MTSSVTVEIVDDDSWQVVTTRETVTIPLPFCDPSWIKYILDMSGSEKKQTL